MEMQNWFCFLWQLLAAFAMAFPESPSTTLGRSASPASPVKTTSLSTTTYDDDKSGQNARHPPPAEELAMRDREIVEEHGSRQSAHYYMEVPDSPLPSDESSAADVEPPPLPCHGPGNPPDDYLNPEPSRDERQEEGAEWKTVRFYENTQLRSVDPEEAAAEPSGDEDRVSDSTQRAERLSEGSSHDEVVASDNASNASLKANVNADILESGYVPYAPPLYENTEP
ncbi:hypothetical protein BaRGS_00038532 [Batillaria attramentaria]|uniref:Uncharacterized protein n=1 Tax=Batillaria attramentaria TaxID=370345 RepID=A0ABD0J5I5_9CAEN